MPVRLRSTQRPPGQHTTDAEDRLSRGSTTTTKVRRGSLLVIALTVVGLVVQGAVSGLFGCLGSAQWCAEQEGETVRTKTLGAAQPDTEPTDGDSTEGNLPVRPDPSLTPVAEAPRGETVSRSAADSDDAPKSSGGDSDGRVVRRDPGNDRASRSRPTDEATAAPTPAASTPAASTPTATTAPPPAPVSAATSAGAVFGDAEIASLPTSGPAWESALRIATAGPSTPDLGNHDSYSQTEALIAALVWRRTGQGVGRDALIATLDKVAGQQNVSAASPLSAFRQLGTWAQVADVLDVPVDSTFGRWIAQQRTAVQAGSGGGYDTVDSCAEGSPNNWGAYCRAARAGIDAYLGDTADLAKVADLHRRWVGDLSVPNTFQPTPGDFSGWIVATGAGNYLDHQGVINPVTNDGRSGVNTSDAIRGSSGPPLQGHGLHYSVGALDGALFTAVVLWHNGYRDVFSWGDNGLQRNGRSLTDADWATIPGSQQHVPFIVNHAYGSVTLPTRPTGTVGRALGLGEWLTAPGSTWLR